MKEAGKQAIKAPLLRRVMVGWLDGCLSHFVILKAKAKAPDQDPPGIHVLSQVIQIIPGD